MNPIENTLLQIFINLYGSGEFVFMGTKKRLAPDSQLEKSETQIATLNILKSKYNELSYQSETVQIVEWQNKKRNIKYKKGSFYMINQSHY